MKKILSLMLASVLVVSMSMVSYAKDDSKRVINSKVLILRENVSREEALQDSTYDINHWEEKTIYSKNVSWHVWGVEPSGYWFEGDFGDNPTGYSEHKNGNTVLSTYHYTRTYLGLLKAGDSGRIWGNYTVRARGSFCSIDVWENSIHYVKYGTEN